MEGPHRGWARRQVRYVAVGRRNAELLRRHRAEYVEELSAKPFGLGSDKWLNSWRAIQHAVDLYGEVLVTDFDCVPTSLFREKDVPRILRRHAGLGRVLQAPLVGYHRRYFHTREDLRKSSGWDQVSQRKGLNLSFLYITSPLLMQLIVEDHVLLSQATNRAPTTEQSLLYCLEKRLGRMTVRDLYNNFEPEVMRLRRSPLPRLGIEKRRVMFCHA
jgi:hypothetical protein